MRILYLGNNRVGLEILTWLKAQSVDIVGAVIHPPDKQKYGTEIIQLSGLPAERIFWGDQLRNPETLARIRMLQPDLGLSVYFGYILKPAFIEQFPKGIINLHPSLLPFNRGAHPNIWSIIEGTPAGATLHYIDTGIDTGAIVAQQEIPVTSIDTGKSLYVRLEDTAIDLFKATWPLILTGNPPRLVQEQAIAATSHRVRDIDTIDEIELDRHYTARELINIIRARTFPPYNGAYFTDENGKRVYLQLHLNYENEGDENE